MKAQEAYHKRIANLLAGTFGSGQILMAYQRGYGDGRCAAAKIAYEADDRIVELEEQFAEAATENRRLHNRLVEALGHKRYWAAEFDKAEAQLAEAQRKRDEAWDACRAALIGRDAAWVDRATLREALERLEWSGHRASDLVQCPVCLRLKRDGKHAPDCFIALALNPQERAKK